MIIKDEDKVIELIELAIKIHHPSVTRKQVENIIINLGNSLQLDRLKIENHDNN